MNFWRKLSLDLGKKLGERVKNDLKAMEIKIPHKEKISDLAGDSSLSPSYIKELIYNSKAKRDLLQIKRYLADEEKVTNIDFKTLKSLRSYVTRKINIKERKS